MADKTTIANRALSLLGAEPVVNLVTDGTTEANIVNRFYDESRRSILSEAPWTFALKREALNLVTSPTPAFVKNGLNFVFQRPADVIKIWDVNNDQFLWQEEGELIYANNDELGILYVFNMIDTTKYTSSFTDAFADKLAADMAYSILNSNTEGQRLLEKYKGDSLPTAMAENAQIGTPDQVDDNLWVLARFGFAPVNAQGFRIA